MDAARYVPPQLNDATRDLYSYAISTRDTDWLIVGQGIRHPSAQARLFRHLNPIGHASHSPVEVAAIPGFRQERDEGHYGRL